MQGTIKYYWKILHRLTQYAYWAESQTSLRTIVAIVTSNHVNIPTAFKHGAIWSLLVASPMWRVAGGKDVKIVPRERAECAQATRAPIFGDVSNLDKSSAMKHATDRKMWNDLLPSKHTSLIWEYSNYYC